MEYSPIDRVHIWMSVAFEGSARAAMMLEARNGGLEALYERVLSGDAELGRYANTDKERRARICADNAYIDAFIETLERDGVTAITKQSPLYPPLLKEIDDPPYVLYARGSAAQKPIEKPFAVIGTRHCTDYGRRVALMMGKALAENGVTVISGLAYGCDSLAHEGALEAQNSDFPTAAILGHGVLINKNDSTQKTMDAILERGVVLSEFLPRTKATSYSFPMRNRLISGISRGVLVVEAGQKSGTMITVGCALDQGRDIYAVPCRITEPINGGTNYMLSQGAAQPVYSVEDLLTQLGIDKTVVKEKKSSAAKISDDGARAVYELIAIGEKSFDTLLELSGLQVEKLNLYLTELEFSGLIRQLPGRVYIIS